MLDVREGVMARAEPKPAERWYVTVRRQPVLARNPKGSRTRYRRTRDALDSSLVAVGPFVERPQGRPTRVLLDFGLSGTYEFSLETGYGVGTHLRDLRLDPDELQKLRAERDRQYPVVSGDRVLLDGPVLPRRKVDLKRYALCDECGAVSGPDDVSCYRRRHGIARMPHLDDCCHLAPYTVGLFVAYGLAALSGVLLVKGRHSGGHEQSAKKQ